MSDHTPSTHLLTALDAPFRVLRERFPEYAPTVGVVVFFSAVAGAVQGVVMSGTGVPAGTDPLASLKALPGMYAMMLPALLLFAIASAVRAVCMANVLAGTDASIGACLRRLLGSPRLWWPLVFTSLVAGINLGCCCYGGFLVNLPFGLILPAALDENLGFASIRRSIDVSLTRTGPDFFDRPGWKVVSAGLASWLGAMALGIVATLPTYVLLGGAYLDAIRSGHPEQIQQALTDLPIWVPVLNGVLGAFANVFPSLYGYTAMFLIFRDAVGRRGGADLERMIAGAPGA